MGPVTKDQAREFSQSATAGEREGIKALSDFAVDGGVLVESPFRDVRVEGARQ